MMFAAYLISCFTAVTPYADCNPPIKAGVEQRIEIALGLHGPDKVLCEKYADAVRQSYTADAKRVAKTKEEKALVDYRQIKYVCILQPAVK